MIRLLPTTLALAALTLTGPASTAAHPDHGTPTTTMKTATWPSYGDPPGIVMARLGDIGLAVLPEHAPAYQRRATLAQIAACTREIRAQYPACLP